MNIYQYLRTFSAWPVADVTATKQKVRNLTFGHFIEGTLNLKNFS